MATLISKQIEQLREVVTPSQASLAGNNKPNSFFTEQPAAPVKEKDGHNDLDATPSLADNELKNISL